MNFDDLMTLDAEYVDMAGFDDFIADGGVEDGDYESGQESDEYCPLDGGDAAWLASAGWGTDEDYGCFGEDY